MENNHEYFKNRTSVLKYSISYLRDGAVGKGKA
jgi:hypothetical protein